MKGARFWTFMEFTGFSMFRQHPGSKLWPSPGDISAYSSIVWVVPSDEYMMKIVIVFSRTDKKNWNWSVVEHDLW